MVGMIPDLRACIGRLSYLFMVFEITEDELGAIPDIVSLRHTPGKGSERSENMRNRANRVVVLRKK